MRSKELPRLKIYRNLLGERWWKCVGNDNVCTTGYGPTPPSAYYNYLQYSRWLEVWQKPLDTPPTSC